MRKLIVSYGFQWFSLELMYLVGTVYEGWIDFRFPFVHKGILVII